MRGGTSDPTSRRSRILALLAGGPRTTHAIRAALDMTQLEANDSIRRLVQEKRLTSAGAVPRATTKGPALVTLWALRS